MGWEGQIRLDWKDLQKSLDESNRSNPLVYPRETEKNPRKPQIKFYNATKIFLIEIF